MPKRKSETVLEKTLRTRNNLTLFKEHGDAALEVAGRSRDELLHDACEALDVLMEFRNIVSSMASLDVSPAFAASMMVADIDIPEA